MKTSSTIFTFSFPFPILLLVLFLCFSCLSGCTSSSSAHSTGPSLAGSLPRLPNGLHYLVLPQSKMHLVYYALSPELFIFCQIFPEENKPVVWQNQQLPLALAWKNGLHDQQKCYAQRIGQAEGNAALASQVSNAPVILSCINQQWHEYCLAAQRALDQSNLSAQEVEQMMCQKPYRCLWQGEQLVILL